MKISLDSIFWIVNEVVIIFVWKDQLVKANCFSRYFYNDKIQRFLLIKNVYDYFWITTAWLLF